MQGDLNYILLFMDTANLLLATKICRDGMHKSFVILLIPASFVIAFSFLVAADVDSVLGVSFMHDIGDWPMRGVVWRIIVGTGLLLHWLSQKSKSLF